MKERLRPLQSRWQMLETKDCWNLLGMCWELSILIIQDVLRTIGCTDDLRTPKTSMIFVIFGPFPGLIDLLSTANISYMYYKWRTIFYQHVTQDNNELCEALVEMRRIHRRKNLTSTGIRTHDLSDKVSLCCS